MCLFVGRFSALTTEPVQPTVSNAATLPTTTQSAELSQSSDATSGNLWFVSRMYPLQSSSDSRTTETSSAVATQTLAFTTGVSSTESQQITPVSMPSSATSSNALSSKLTNSITQTSWSSLESSAYVGSSVITVITTNIPHTSPSSAALPTPTQSMETALSSDPTLASFTSIPASTSVLRNSTWMAEEDAASLSPLLPTVQSTGVAETSSAAASSTLPVTTASLSTNMSTYANAMRATTLYETTLIPLLSTGSGLLEQ